MQNTGRIRELLDRRARQIVFGVEVSENAVVNELPLYAEIDRAHAVMLVERRLLSREDARRILTAIDALIAEDYASLRGREPSRGLYLLYEHWFTETLGERLGGAVHIGRSRNDINATVLRLRVRPIYRRVVRELLRLLVALVRGSEKYSRLTMPAYTHHRPALPITYGHYLAGVATALLRDLQGIEDAARELDWSPLGAGAVGGTTLPIDTERTAQLLGFSTGVGHSVDAVASRDLVLRLLGSSTVFGVTLSRLAADLQLWSTEEFGFVDFADRLVGASSMMPQKRNAFLLEHIKGRAASPLGAFGTATMSMHATPFSNSVAVGAEGVRPLWGALQDVTEATVLLRLMVAGAEPRSTRMHERAVDGFTCATELANRLSIDAGMSFREAHYQVGDAVRTSMRRREPLAVAGDRLLRQHGLVCDASWLDPGAVAAGAVFGGGPGGDSLARTIEELRRRISTSARAIRERCRQWTEGRMALNAAAASV